jgi:hypothetical protein
MSLWYIQQFQENIGNILSWQHGGKKLQSYPLIERMIDEQGLRQGVKHG